MGANTDISIPILSRMKRGNMKLDLSLDYHAHILPGCDHGSDGLATSLKQVEMAASAGVKTICATPHFYPHKESVESFLRRRKKTAGLLLRELPENAPLIQLGAEVLICDGMERLDGLNRLCREGTNELLLEMPFYAWPESIWDTLYGKGCDCSFPADVAGRPDFVPYPIWECNGFPWLSHSAFL